MKKVIIAISLACAQLGFALLGVNLCVHTIENIQERKGHELYANVQSALSEYPKLSEQFQFTEFFFRDGATEYMLLKNGDKQITGVRSEGAEAIYYMDGKSWELTEAGLTEKNAVEDPIQTVIADQVKDLLADKEISYSYHKARRMPTPLWVYIGESYIQCERTEYPGYVEVMVYDELDYGKYLRWNIVRSSEDEDVVLFLSMREYIQNLDTDDPMHIAGWGEIDRDIIAAVFG